MARLTWEHRPRRDSLVKTKAKQLLWTHAVGGREEKFPKKDDDIWEENKGARQTVYDNVSAFLSNPIAFTYLPEQEEKT